MVNRFTNFPWPSLSTRLPILVVASVVAWLGTSAFLAGAPADLRRSRESVINREAMQILKAECFGCHNPEKKKGGLGFTSRETLLSGGDDGAVVMPGKPESSRLAKVLLRDSDPHMPLKKQLPDAQIKIIHDWIKGGVVWDAAALAEDETRINPVELLTLPSSYQPVAALALSLDGQKLAVGRGGSVVVHDASQTNYPVLAQWDAHRDAVQALAWSGDAHWLASGAFRRLELWDGRTYKLMRECTNGMVGRVTVIVFAPDGHTLALADGIAAESGIVQMISVDDGKLVASWRAHADTIFGMEFSRDGKRLATAGGDKLIKIWDVGSTKELSRLEGHTAQVLGVAFNTNATQLVSAGADKQLRVWDLPTREKIISLGNHSAAVTAVAWGNEENVIVASTEEGGVFIYKNLKPHTGEQSSGTGDEKRIGDAGDAVLSIALPPDAKRVFAGSHDGVVHVWSSEGKLLTKLESSAVATTAAMTWISLSNTVTQPRAPALPKAKVASRPPKSKISGIVSLKAEPNLIQLFRDSPRHGVLISAQTMDGFDIDVTGEVRLSASRPAPFEITLSGEIRALNPGAGVLTAHFRGKQVQVPVQVHGAAPTNSFSSFSEPPVSFLRDVLPGLSKAGCNAGACHAKADGQNGFKLSVFSYDPKSDYAHIVKDARGRRVFPAAPDESLIIKKPTTALPHEGGLRFERGSETHQLLVRWLREGMAYTVTNEPALQHLVVFPRERRYRKGATQRLLVEAYYSDGSVRDVTRLAAFDSNDKEIATVDERGVVTLGTLAGQGVIVARYMGSVADSQILVPADRLLPSASYAALPRNNFIDDLADAHFQRLGLLPSELCTDAEFIRRAHLDAIGVLPTPDEVREFLNLRGGRGNEALSSPIPNDQSLLTPAATDSSNRRRALIDRLLARPEYADYWANKWGDLLRPNPDRVGVKSVFTLDQWLRESFRQNKPYDQFVREILVAEGTNHRDGPAVIYRDRREPADLTTMFSQLFLGTRLECARCHHHPNEKWSQDDFYQFAAYFGPLKQKGAGLSPPISAGTETFYFAPGGSVKHPVTGAVMSPRPPDSLPSQTTQGTDPRRALADWLTAPENPFFARAAVNRVWAVFFGRGLVEPVDDFRVSNPCVNPALLAGLAEDFAKHGYDLKHLIRTIMESRLYQLSATPNEFNLADARNFSRGYRRRLPAEVLFDAVNDATGVSDTFAAMPIGSRALQTWSYKIESHFMDAFGRPNPSTDCPCERDRQMSVVQSLHLMNSKNLQSKLSNPMGRARRLADSDKPSNEIVTDLYLATLSRTPSDDELKVALAAFSGAGATRQSATEDVFWALLNSAEFVFNH